MTILVGYLSDRGGRGALDLGAQLARSDGSDLVVVSVVAAGWSIPSPAKVDAEYIEWAKSQGEAAASTAAAYLASAAPDVTSNCVWVPGKSVASALVDACHTYDADVLVLGSSTDGRHGQVVVGSTADRLLHSAPVALALAPRGYRASPGSRISRVTCSFAGDELSIDVLGLTAELSQRVGASLRVATFGVRGRTMYPPEVGLHPEDEVLQSWFEQTKATQDMALAKLAANGVLPSDTSTVIATGRGWTEALDDAPWKADEVLVVGSSSASLLSRVFLGSRATKIVRHSPVPVIVVPAAVAEAG